MMFTRVQYWLGALACFAISGLVRAESPKALVPISNFSEVSPGLYRGAAPDDAGLDYLSSLKVKTDVDLESFRLPVILDEKGDGKALDIQFVSEPLFSLPGFLSFFQPPITDKRVNEILAILSDETRYPVYVHCEKGEDRTGLIIGLYRVLIQKESPEVAWNEMLKFGYHPHFQKLTHYFEKRTGWKPATQH